MTDFRYRTGAVRTLIALAWAGALLFCGGACSQSWTFHHGPPLLNDEPTGAPAPAATPRNTPANGGVPDSDDRYGPAAAPCGPGPAAAVRPAQPERSVPSYFGPVPPVMVGGVVPAGAELPAPDDPSDPTMVMAPQAAHGDGTGQSWPGATPTPTPLPAPDESLTFTSQFGAKFHEQSQHLRSDYANFYSGPSLTGLILGLGAGGIMANTRIDTDFRDWDQRYARSRDTNHAADFVRDFGNGWVLVPAMAGMAVLGEVFEDRPVLGVVGDFGERATRAYLVGGPPMLALQYVTGGARPNDNGMPSSWDPFHAHNGVSGHAFVSAVPLITAAKMTDNPWAKGVLYFASTLTAWSRVNDDAHYLSQATLGWWMAYLACQAVDHTEQTRRYFKVEPWMTPEGSGVGIVFER